MFSFFFYILKVIRIFAENKYFMMIKYEIKIDVWKPTGKWYTSELFFVENLDQIESKIKSFNRYEGMWCTTSYWPTNEEKYYYPYRHYII